MASAHATIYPFTILKYGARELTSENQYIHCLVQFRRLLSIDRAGVASEAWLQC